MEVELCSRKRAGFPPERVGEGLIASVRLLFGAGGLVLEKNIIEDWPRTKGFDR
jgi:hypothetical protein